MRFFGKGRRNTSVKDPLHFGNIAVSLGLINELQLGIALEKQAEPLDIGDLLVALRFITPVQREDVLIEQMRRRGRSRRALVHAELQRQKTMAATIRSSLSELVALSQQAVVAPKPK